MQEQFYKLSEDLIGQLKADEVLLCVLDGEDSDFVRFNSGLVRQAGGVSQKVVSLELIRGQRHAKMSLAVSGRSDQDKPAALAALQRLRDALPSLPEDPYLLYSTDVRSSTRQGANSLPDSSLVMGEVLAQAKGLDLVGILAQGGIYAGFANSLGQRNWFSSFTFHLDWSIYHHADKAVKCTYAGFEWDSATFASKMSAAAEQLAILARPAKTIPPGQYRVFLAPEALAEYVGMLAWGGFGVKAHRTMFTPLLKMTQQGATLSRELTVRENTAEGIAPDFQSAGYIKPTSVTVIQEGRLADLLVSPRSAKEYGLAPNADGGEGPESLDMSGGGLDQADVLARLDTGIYINRLWYLNYSDRPSGRITGMTRFATFWVEGGKIVAPLEVMRFDETIFRALGENLLGLTRQREFIPSSSTYGARSPSSKRLPGALIKDFAFTL